MAISFIVGQTFGIKVGSAAVYPTGNQRSFAITQRRDASATQPGAGRAPIVETDILGPSEAFRQQMDYFSHSTNARALLQRLAPTQPATLACMHGSAWRGDGAALLRALAVAICP